MNDSLNLPLLKGSKVLICRPEPGASALESALLAVGAECYRLPCITIERYDLGSEEKDMILNLDRYEHVIALSQHAAQFACESIDEYWPQLPVGQHWHAIGRKTAQVLKDHDIPTLSPDGDMTTEGLIENAAFQNLANKKVLLLKGHKGRKKLSQVLRQRGAQVDSLELYERKCPVYSDETLHSALSVFDADCIVTLSAETLENLHSFAKQANANLGEKLFVVSSARVAELASNLGYPLSYVPENLMPMDIIKSIIAARRSRRSS